MEITKNMKKIFKGIVILLIAITIFFSTNIITADNLENQISLPFEPNINIEKLVLDENNNWQDADTKRKAVDLQIGHDVKFKIQMTNTGDVPLIIGLTDEMHDSLKYIGAEPEPFEVSHDPPFWYIGWVTYEYLMPGEMVEFTLIAHVEGPENSLDYNYGIILGVTDDGKIVMDHDYAYVQLYKKAREIKSPLLNLLQNFLQYHTNLLPILQKLGCGQ